MKNVKLFSICFVFVATLISCESSKVSTMMATDTNLDFYQSYAYFGDSEYIEDDTVVKNKTDVSTDIIRSVDRNMKNAGFEYNEENPDVLVLICATTNEGTSVDAGINSFAVASPANAIGPFYSPYYFRGPEIYPTAIPFNPNLDGRLEGTVMIQLIDKNDLKTIWKGIAANDIYAKTSSYNLELLINNIFEEYPERENDLTKFRKQKIASSTLTKM